MCGTNNSHLRERLLPKEKLTLDECIQMCRAAELSKENARTIEGNAIGEVHAIKHATGQNKPENVFFHANSVGEDTHKKNLNVLHIESGAKNGTCEQRMGEI